MPNNWSPNEQTLNGSSEGAAFDWEVSSPIERQKLFLLDIGNLRLPISSAQATMRLTGQSYLQAIVPAGDQYVDELATLVDEQMLLKSGYMYADGTLSPLEVIANAPFEQLSRSEGSASDKLTLEGYGVMEAASDNTRSLNEVRNRSTSATGRRRVRCSIDLFLRPGHTAIDGDGVSFTVGIIQYFINSSSDAMEVIQDG